MASTRFLALLVALASCALAIDVSICADFNTASTDRNTSNLQTNGLCSDFCRGSYVFAITSHENCWCSNYAPTSDDTVDTSMCDFPCLAYPFEYCGSKDNKLYSYLNLGLKPSGTRGPNDGASDGSDDASSTSAPKTVSTKSSSPPSSSPPPQTLSTSSESSTTSSTSTKSASQTIQTVTVDGTTRTVILTPTGTSDNNNKPSAAATTGSSGIGGGAIAGIVIGAIAGIALLGFLLWFFLRRRKQDDDNQFRDDPSIRGSSRGRMGSHQHDLSIAGSAASPGSAGNRSSMLQVDPRMDPFKQNLYMRNGSAESVNTLRDEHDYSRRIQQPKVLRATNPDPDT